MRVNHKLFCVVLMAVLLCLPAHATYKEILENTVEVETQIQEMLDRFAETGEYTILRDASAMLFPGYRDGDEPVDWMPVRNRVLVLRLRVLEACYEAKDPNFVMNAPWPRNIYPPRPLLGNEKENPEAIKKHDEQMAEYKAYRANRSRQVRLKKLFDSRIGDLGIYLKNMAHNPNLSVDDDIATIKAVVKNEQLREDILRPLSGIKDRSKKETPILELDSDGTAVDADIESSPAPPVAPPCNPVVQKPEPETNAVPSITNSLPGEAPPSEPVEKTTNPWKFLLPVLGVLLAGIALFFRSRK